MPEAYRQRYTEAGYKRMYMQVGYRWPMNLGECMQVGYRPKYTALVYQPTYILEAHTVQSRPMYTLEGYRLMCTQMVYRHPRTLKACTLVEYRLMYTLEEYRPKYTALVACRRTYTALACAQRCTALVYKLSYILQVCTGVVCRPKCTREAYTLK